MTGDQSGGLLQIPCIERNAFRAVKVVNAARLAVQDASLHEVSLYEVTRTKYRTGLALQSRYKETALATTSQLSRPRLSGVRDAGVTECTVSFLWPCSYSSGYCKEGRLNDRPAFDPA